VERSGTPGIEQLRKEPWKGDLFLFAMFIAPPGLIAKLNPTRGFRFASPPAIHNSPLRGLERLMIIAKNRQH
jgi:hypothetical protein